MDAVGGDKTGQVALGQELPPHVDKGHALGKGQSRHRVGVQLLVAVNASHISQPAQHAAAVRLLGDKSEIPLSVNGRQRHQHRLYTGGLQRRDGAVQLLRKLRQSCAGQVVLLRRGGDGLPVEIAVIAAVSHQRPAGIHAPLHIVLHQRQALGHCGAHLGAVHHLQPVAGILGHHLRQMEVVAHIRVGHGGLQQRITVDKSTFHRTASPCGFYLI